MRTPTSFGSASWPMRICQPWLVASLGGLAIGFSLLRLESVESPRLDEAYEMSETRAAVFDQNYPGYAPPSAFDPGAPISTDLSSSLFELPDAGGLSLLSESGADTFGSNSE